MLSPGPPHDGGVLILVARYRPKINWLLVTWKSILATGMCWSSFSDCSHWISPHGCVVCGSLATRFSAAGLKRAGLMRLPTKGAPRLICLPAHAGDVIVVKSPASIWAVGTYAMLLDGTWRRMVPW